MCVKIAGALKACQIVAPCFKLTHFEKGEIKKHKQAKGIQLIAPL